MGPGILWVDLAADASRRTVGILCGRFQVQVVHQLRDVAVAVQRLQPSVICFDFQAPGSQELFALRECKRLFPSVPILMITEAHSEMLAVWALRARVWDYLVKPFSMHRLCTVLEELAERMRDVPARPQRRTWFPQENGNEAGLRPALAGAPRVIAEAKLYVQAHLSEKIVASQVAEHCGLSQFHFSRLFKRETGITFNEYVAKVRVTKAMTLLHDPHMSVSRAAVEVGFLDLSYFAKVFRRYADMCPREYLELHRSPAVDVPAPKRTWRDPDEQRPALYLNT